MGNACFDGKRENADIHIGLQTPYGESIFEEEDCVSMKRQQGDEAVLLRSVLDSAARMLKRYDLRLLYTIDVKDNSYTTDVVPNGLDQVGVLMRLQRHDVLQEIMEEIISAPDLVAREKAIQRGRCALDTQALRIVE